MRSAVNLADGFWYQHSFMSLAMEVKVCKKRGINQFKHYNILIVVMCYCTFTYWV